MGASALDLTGRRHVGGVLPWKTTIDRLCPALHVKEISKRSPKKNRRQREKKTHDLPQQSCPSSPFLSLWLCLPMCMRILIQVPQVISSEPRTLLIINKHDRPSLVVNPPISNTISLRLFFKFAGVDNLSATSQPCCYDACIHASFLQLSGCRQRQRHHTLVWCSPTASIPKTSWGRPGTSPNAGSSPLSPSSLGGRSR